MNDSSYASRRQRQRWLSSRGPRITNGSLFVIGLLIGLAAALYYAWIEEPVTFTEASPARLRASYKSEYILLVSESYQADGNWEVAEERLAALGEADPGQVILDQMESFLRDGRSSNELASLANLARQAGSESPVLDVFAPPQSTTLSVQANSDGTLQSFERATATAASPSAIEAGQGQATSTPLPSPSPTQFPPYRLLKMEKVCNPGGPIDRIEVIILDSLLEPLPGVEVHVNWDGGQDHFFTGFKPELGRGYGDITIEPDITYELTVAESNRVVGDLRLEVCDSLLGGYLGGWRLTFQNTDVRPETPAP